MSLLNAKLEASVEIRLPASQHHDIFSVRPHHMSYMAPTKIKNCVVHQGDWGKSDSILIFDFFHDGVVKVAKDIVHVDDATRTTTFTVIDGDILKEYKAFKFVVQSTPGSSSGDTTTLVKWAVEYEKLTEDGPEPYSLLELVINLTKDIDDHHHIQK